MCAHSNGIDVILIKRALKICLTRLDRPIYKVSTPSPDAAPIGNRHAVTGVREAAINGSFFDLNEWGTKVWIPVS